MPGLGSWCARLFEYLSGQPRGDMLDDVGADGGAGNGQRVSLAALDLPVVAASDDELAAHQAQLDELDKSVKGTCVWRTSADAAAEAA